MLGPPTRLAIELKSATKIPAGKRRRINIRGKKGQKFSPPAGRLGGGPQRSGTAVPLRVPAGGNPEVTVTEVGA